jgi:hypothetical protein
MAKRAALLTVHGMGDTEEDYADDLLEEVRDRLGAKSADLHTGAIYYQNVLQENEDRVWDAVESKVDWHDLRRFILYGFADAAGLADSRTEPTGIYVRAQIRIARELLAARAATNAGPVVVLAHSLGCQVISNYLWDARPLPDGVKPSSGIWRDLPAFEARITGGRPLLPEEIAYLRGGNLRALHTTGCNIPIFVAARAKKDIVPFPKPHPAFTWDNWYDEDDVLGWPLADLSPEYGAAVRDHEVNAASGLFGGVTQGWGPQSHGAYWEDDDVLDPLETSVRSFL